MKRLSIVGLYITFSLQTLSAYADPTSQFKHWYQDYANVFSEILRTNCTEEYDIYLRQKNPIPVRFIDEGQFRYAGPVVICLLENTPETIKVDMASASVILGLTPAILALTGSTLSEISLLAIRRPILASLIAIGSPFVSPLRAFDYTNPVAPLAQVAAPLTLAPFTKTRQAVLSIAEYALALGALANLSTTTWQLATRTVSSTSFDVQYLIPIWNSIIPAIFLCNYAALRLRVYVSPTEPRTEEHEKPSIRSRLFDSLCSETTPCASQPLLVLRWKRESYSFLVFSFFTSVLTSCYLLYATLVFSSVLFISSRNAVTVFAKQLATVLVSRMVLMVEIAGLRSIARAHQSIETKEGDVIKPE
jgi:hypothetical protein